MTYVMSITLVTKTTRCHPVTSLVRRAVSATGPPTRSASTHLAAGWTAALPHAWQSSGPHAHSITEHDRWRRRTTTDDSVQNNTGPLGGPVINRVQLRLMTCKKWQPFSWLSTARSSPAWTSSKWSWSWITEPKSCTHIGHRNPSRISTPAMMTTDSCQSPHYLPRPLFTETIQHGHKCTHV